MTELHPAIREFLGEMPFDPAALRKRYAEERDLRLADRGRKSHVAGATTRFAHAPTHEPPAAREPVTDTVEFTIIGGGFAGLVAGARLREAGYDSIRIVEGGGDFGGTWFWNRYPGVMCDIESYCYMPMLDELNYIPSQRYATGEEIYQHCRRIASKYDLYDLALLETTLDQATWDDDQEVWVISTSRGDRFRSRYLLSGTGAAHRIKLPAIPGVDEFEGASFHTNRWDYGYTGGDSTGGLTGLQDKHVAIIGTGATAIQAIPHLAEWAKHLTVFQRTPSSIDMRNNAPTDPEWASSLESGWQRDRQDNFNGLLSGAFQETDLVSDGWTDVNRRLFGPDMIALRENLGRDLTLEEFGAIAELLDMQKMEKIRRRVDETVQDPDTAALLKPWYPQFCKRPCFHDGYLDTFNRPNVSLVDTSGHGVEAITAGGVVANGQEFPVDCIIFATGFEIGSEYRRGPGKSIIGRGGRDLDTHWKSGLRTLHGVVSDDFPNMFVLGFTQGAFTPSFPHTLEGQIQHIIYLLDRTRERGASTIEAEPAAVDDFVDSIRNSAGVLDDFYRACTPGYYNGEGDLRNGAFYEVHRGGAITFFRGLQEWRDAGELEGIRFGGSGSTLPESASH